MKSIDAEQLQSAYYAFYRADVNYRAFVQCWRPTTVRTYHDILSSPEGTYLYVWHGLLFALLEFLKKFDDGIPINVRSEVDVFYEPLRKFRNAIFHIHNHPYSEKQDQIVKIPDAIQRVEMIHHAVGEYLFSSFGYSYLPLLSNAASQADREFFVPVTYRKEHTVPETIESERMKSAVLRKVGNGTNPT